MDDSCILPLEILNQIYLERATWILKDKLGKAHINYDKFVTYLEEMGGFVMGSFALSCFDISFEPKDLDLFLNIPRGDKRPSYWKFPGLLEKFGEVEVSSGFPFGVDEGFERVQEWNSDSSNEDPGPSSDSSNEDPGPSSDSSNEDPGPSSDSSNEDHVKEIVPLQIPLFVEKLPIVNSACESDPTDYKYKLMIGEGLMHVDINILKNEPDFTMRDDCCSIKFTSKGWVLPPTMNKNIGLYLIKKKSNDLSSLPVFTEFYDAWGFNFYGNMMRAIQSYNLTPFVSEHLPDSNYQKLVPCYNHNDQQTGFDAYYNHKTSKWVCMTKDSHAINYEGLEQEKKALINAKYGIQYTDGPIFVQSDEMPSYYHLGSWDNENDDVQPGWGDENDDVRPGNDLAFRPGWGDENDDVRPGNDLAFRPSWDNGAGTQPPEDFKPHANLHPIPDEMIDVYLITQNKTQFDIPTPLSEATTKPLFALYKKTHRLLKYIQRGYKFPSTAFDVVD